MQGSDAYRLIVRRGPQPNQIYELTGEITNLGRDITNDIVINDREVSRHHLRFMRGSEGYTIEDLGSTNGTFVNGKRVTGATPLKNGDMLGLGETVTLQFERVDARADEPTPAESAPGGQQTMQSASSQQADDNERFKPRSQPNEARNPYQRPQEGPSLQEQPAAVAQPQPAGYASPQGYDQQVLPDYGPQPGEGGGYQPAQAYGPPPPGYDYDPYRMREDEGGGAMQWLLIGCLGLLLFCGCATVVLAVVVDAFCLYESVPFLTDILNALGLAVTCT